MIEIVVGAVIGALVSLIIAETYHRRASKETSKEIEKLSALNSETREALDSAIRLIKVLTGNSELIKKHATKGTVDDEEYPYK